MEDLGCPLSLLYGYIMSNTSDIGDMTLDGISHLVMRAKTLLQLEFTGR